METPIKDITEEDVQEYFANCFNVSVGAMPIMSIHLPTKYELNFCYKHKSNIHVSLQVGILGRITRIPFRFYDWNNYPNWDIKNRILNFWGDSVSNWILLKKLELLID